MHVFGKFAPLKLEVGMTPVVVTVQTSLDACITVYKILKARSPDFVAIHNGFGSGFDLRKIATHSAASD